MSHFLFFIFPANSDNRKSYILNVIYKNVIFHFSWEFDLFEFESLFQILLFNFYYIFPSVYRFLLLFISAPIT